MKIGPMRLGYSAVWWLVHILVKLFFGVRVQGIEKIPLEGKLLIVCNHISNFDPPVVGSHIPREIHYAAKINLFKGLLGKLLAYLNSIPVRRHGSDKESIREMVRRLKNDQAVLIFPEGTRVANPTGNEHKAGVGMLAMMAHADLLPIRIDGTLRVRENLFRRGAVQVTVGERICLEELLKDNPPKREAYYRIADAVMDEVRDLEEGVPEWIR